MVALDGKFLNSTDLADVQAIANPHAWTSECLLGYEANF